MSDVQASVAILVEKCCTDIGGAREYKGVVSFSDSNEETVSSLDY